MRTYSTSGVAAWLVDAAFTVVPVDAVDVVVVAGSGAVVAVFDVAELVAACVAFALPAAVAPAELTGESERPRWVD
ncbi:MAG: hypothetical protein AAF183_06120 [Pseudomonadota bacterium]